LTWSFFFFLACQKPPVCILFFLGLSVCVCMHVCVRVRCLQLDGRACLLAFLMLHKHPPPSPGWYENGGLFCVHVRCMHMDGRACLLGFLMLATQASTTFAHAANGGLLTSRKLQPPPTFAHANGGLLSKRTKRGAFDFKKTTTTTFAHANGGLLTWRIFQPPPSHMQTGGF